MAGTASKIRENMDRGMDKRPWPEIAKELNIKLTTVYRRVAEEKVRRRKLIKAETMAKFGILPKAEPVEVPDREDRQAPPKRLSAEELLAEITASTVMTKEERLKALSYLARNAPHAVQVNAIAKLEEFERAAGSQFGPPPPTTDDDVVLYLTELFDGINPTLIEKALKNAKAAISPETSPDSLGGCEA